MDILSAFVLAIFLFALIFLCLFTLSRGRSKASKPTGDLEVQSQENFFPFHKKQYLMTQTEHKFFDVLKEIIQDKYFIMPQVALSRIIETENGLDRYGSDSWYSNFNRINKKSVDFVIFDKQYFTPLLVIELDDHTHNFYNRRQRDEFLDSALKAANLNILHIKPQMVYNKNALKDALRLSL